MNDIIFIKYDCHEFMTFQLLRWRQEWVAYNIDHDIIIILQVMCVAISLRAFTPFIRYHKKNPFIDVFYHQSLERHPGHTARAPPFSRGGRVQTGDQTTASPMP